MPIFYLVLSLSQEIVNLVHSLKACNGGVSSATIALQKAIIELGQTCLSIENEDFQLGRNTCIIAHGLWQWPSVVAYRNLKKYQSPYIIFPHGMLDPWFKISYPRKHLKKQIYWWWRQGKILKSAHAVCYTTEEERLLGQKTFWPYKCREVVTGLGVTDPPENEEMQKLVFEKTFPQVFGKKILLYMGRIHPKKGLDMLLNSFSRYSREDNILVISGPIDETEPYLQKLQSASKVLGKKVLWTGMLENDLKWGALRKASALVLPSHQENYGMVVAEACSVGTPVFLTNKVNLYREILDYDAGVVDNDSQLGVNNLVMEWVNGKHEQMKGHALKCFYEKLHISKTAKKILELFEEAKGSNRK